MFKELKKYQKKLVDLYSRFCYSCKTIDYIYIYTYSYEVLFLFLNLILDTSTPKIIGTGYRGIFVNWLYLGLL